MDKVCYWDSDLGMQRERNCTPEEQAEIDARRAALPPAPAKVTRRQALSALRINGITASMVEAAINSLPITELEQDLAMIEFRESLEFEYNRPLVVQMCAAMSLNRYELFMLAATL